MFFKAYLWVRVAETDVKRKLAKSGIWKHKVSAVSVPIGYPSDQSPRWRTQRRARGAKPEDDIRAPGPFSPPNSNDVVLTIGDKSKSSGDPNEKGPPCS